MSKPNEHAKISVLRRQLSSGSLDRREFVRFAALLGVSATAAYAAAGKIVGEDFAPAATAQTMPRGGIVKIGMRVMDVSSPHTYSWVFDSNIGRGVHEYLTRTGADNVTRPHLLEGWTPSEDLMTWDLHLRKDVKWHNGRDFVASGVIWNLTRTLDAVVGSSLIGYMTGYMLE